jgi:hypothetical protein
VAQPAGKWRAQKAMRSKIPHTSGFGWLGSLLRLPSLTSLDRKGPRADRCPLVSCHELLSEAEPWLTRSKDVQELYFMWEVALKLSVQGTLHKVFSVHFATSLASGRYS